MDFGVPNLERDTELVGVLKQKVWFNLQKVSRISSKNVPDDVENLLEHSVGGCCRGSHVAGFFSAKKRERH